MKHQITHYDFDAQSKTDAFKMFSMDDKIKIFSWQPKYCRS